MAQSCPHGPKLAQLTVLLYSSRLYVYVGRFGAAPYLLSFHADAAQSHYFVLVSRQLFEHRMSLANVKQSRCCQQECQLEFVTSPVMTKRSMRPFIQMLLDGIGRKGIWWPQGTFLSVLTGWQKNLTAASVGRWRHSHVTCWSRDRNAGRWLVLTTVLTTTRTGQ